MFKFALTELRLWLYITQGFALGYINFALSALGFVLPPTCTYALR